MRLPTRPPLLTYLLTYYAGGGGNEGNLLGHVFATVLKWCGSGST